MTPRIKHQLQPARDIDDSTKLCKTMRTKEPRLVMVLGTSPAIVTETLYQLEANHEFKLGIRRIDLITTAVGRTACEDRLKSKLAELEADYGLGRVSLDWRMLQDESGKELRDIETPSESLRAAGSTLAIVGECCSQTDGPVFASIAGGRKTMSYYLGMAMSYYARQQDRLYHVLVPSEFEKPGSDFYYPKPGMKSPIMLQDLPFLRLRGFLERRNPSLYHGAADFIQLANSANRALGAPLPRYYTLKLDEKSRTVTIPELSSEPLTLQRRKFQCLMIAVLAAQNGVPVEDAIPEFVDTLVKRSLVKRTDRKTEVRILGTRFGTRLSEVNLELESNFSYRVRIESSTAAAPGQPAIYILPDGMRVEVIDAGGVK
ncbi:MAG: TIGR02584 family CRISPR-associated protein [Calditrichaeota bacterium]|nr:TIGR02584 family CRISPR-associated protein [Calditrichota bacterium]